MSTIPRRNQHLTDSRDREATRSMGASRDFTTGIDTGVPTAVRERTAPRVTGKTARRTAPSEAAWFEAGRQLPRPAGATADEAE